MNTRQKHGDRLNLWVGEDHNKIYGVALVLDLIANINIHDVVLENTTTTLGTPYSCLVIVLLFFRKYSTSSSGSNAIFSFSFMCLYIGYACAL
jgi:hypothetical protein